MTNGDGLPATGTVTITVTAAPLGTNDAYTVAAGQRPDRAGPGVLANDTDADSPALQASSSTEPGPRDAGPPAERRLHLHADGRLLRHGQLHLSGHRPDQLSQPLRSPSPSRLPVQNQATPAAGDPGRATTPSPTAANDTYTVAAQTTLTVPAPGRPRQRHRSRLARLSRPAS